MSPAILQTFIDTPNFVLEYRVQYSTIHFPNVVCDDHHQVHRDFLITLYEVTWKKTYVKANRAGRWTALQTPIFWDIAPPR